MTEPGHSPLQNLAQVARSHGPITKYVELNPLLPLGASNSQLRSHNGSQTSHNQWLLPPTRTGSRGPKDTTGSETSPASVKGEESSSRISSTAGGQKKMACVDCRQQKARCDAHVRYPLPCTRCTKKGLTCSLKLDYKRTSKKAKLAQIEKEFLALKQKLLDAQRGGLAPNSPLSQDIGFTRPIGANGSHFTSSTQIVGMNINPNIPPSLQAPQGATNTMVPYSLPAVPSLLQGTPQNHYSRPTQHSHNNGSLLPNTMVQDPTLQSLSTGVLHGRPGYELLPSTNSIPNTPSIRPPINTLHTPQETIKLDNSTLTCTAKCIHDIALEPPLIKLLYKEYVANYHPILPMVEVERGPEKLYRLSPALFWVVMIVSLRRTEGEKELMIKLSPVIKSILAEILISPVTQYNPQELDLPILNEASVYSVQALLLYSFWPPITSSLSADSSWNTLGAAIFLAMRLGIHTSDRANEVRTWIACNVVSQTIASTFGYQAFAQFDSCFWSASRAPVPGDLTAMMEIAQFEDQINKTLNLNTLDPYGLADPAARLPLVKVLLRHLDELDMRLTQVQHYDGLRNFQLLLARVHLLTYYFMDQARIAPFELQKGLVQVYNAAVALVNHAQMCQSKDQKFVKYLPGVHVVNIWQALCIIGRVAHLPLKKFIDFGTGKATYQAAVELVAKALILKHDIAYRLSGIMRNMWQVFRDLDEKKANEAVQVQIRTRMSALIFFDCLNLLRNHVGSFKATGEEDQNLGVEEDSSSEEVVESDGEADTGSANVPKRTPGSIQGTGSSSSPMSQTSSSSRKKRTLSNTRDAEARKIIRTVPLDPQPIQAGGGKRLTIFNVVNQTPHRDIQLPENGSNLQDIKETMANTNEHDSYKPQALITAADIGWGNLPMQMNMDYLDESTLDNGEMLWKDVESVLNDFGFQTQF